MSELQAEFARAREKSEALQAKVQMLEELNAELESVKVRYLEEVKEHHRLSATLEAYKASGKDI